MLGTRNARRALSPLPARESRGRRRADPAGQPPQPGVPGLTGRCPLASCDFAEYKDHDVWTSVFPVLDVRRFSVNIRLNEAFIHLFIAPVSRSRFEMVLPSAFYLQLGSI